MKKAILISFLSIAQIAHSQQKDYVISGQQFAVAQNDSVSFDIAVDQHNYYFKSDPIKSRSYAQEMLQTGLRSRNLNRQYKAYTALARCERKGRNYDSVLHFDMLSYKTANKIAERNILYDATITLSRDLLDAEKFSEALNYLKAAQILAKQNKNTDQIAKTDQTLGHYYANTNKHKLSIPYFKKAIKYFRKKSDEKMAIAYTTFLVESMLAIKSTNEIGLYLIDALKYYTHNGPAYKQAFCYTLLGKVNTIDGDIDKGINHYKKARELYFQDNNFTEYALAGLDIANIYLARKETALAKPFLPECDSILSSAGYESGIIQLRIAQGNNESQNGNFVSADRYFTEAGRLIKSDNQINYSIELDKQLANHFYRQKKNKVADSFAYQYATKTAAVKEPEEIIRTLNLLKQKNKNIDSNTLSLLQLAYTPGGAEKLKEYLNNTDLSNILPMEFFLGMNPYSMGTETYDSLMTLTFHEQYQNLEVKYKTKQKEDSIKRVSDHLKVNKQQLDIATQKLKIYSIAIGSIILILALLIIILRLQVRYRKTTEKDKQKIELLNNEIHHRVRNNLNILNRLIDVAGKDNEGDKITSLKGKISAIALLHEKLYQKQLFGEIYLQEYLEDLSKAIKETFILKIPVEIDINALYFINSKTTEVLGLMISELITNSLKYAFPASKKGKIIINLFQDDDAIFELNYYDNGIGMIADAKHTGYGVKLINGLGSMLGGKARYIPHNGTHFQIKFAIQNPEKNNEKTESAPGRK